MFEEDGIYIIVDQYDISRFVKILDEDEDKYYCLSHDYYNILKKKRLESVEDIFEFVIKDKTYELEIVKLDDLSSSFPVSYGSSDAQICDYSYGSYQNYIDSEFGGDVGMFMEYHHLKIEKCIKKEYRGEYKYLIFDKKYSITLTIEYFISNYRNCIYSFIDHFGYVLLNRPEYHIYQNETRIRGINQILNS